MTPKILKHYLRYMLIEIFYLYLPENNVLIIKIIENMKRLFAILPLFVALLVACDTDTPTTQPGPDVDGPSVEITSSTEVTLGQGSSAGLIIRYKLHNASEEYTLEATSDVDWINSFDLSKDGLIKFSVDANPSPILREGVITLKYAESAATVKVIQKEEAAPEPQVIVAEHLDIKYYGITPGTMLHNYYLAFSNNGMDANNYYTVPDSKYYFVDLFTEQAPTDLNNITIPFGVYNYDSNNSGNSGTFTSSYSWYQIIDEYGAIVRDLNGNGWFDYQTGVLTVEQGKVTLDVMMNIFGVQELHRVIFEGEYNMLDCTAEQQQ